MIYEDIKCPSCSQTKWTHESTTIISGRVWLTCECGNEEEVRHDK